ncbi:hypothetical protein NE689_10250 [Lactonifactor longoviformis]|uniref:hypothetical protein n=1 Tax=Lactonifactor longoviformis TaxID=341220 RepID=UPI00210ABA1B|nr:hypothetical protein [Lactonifactor longoviformis]MCQ4671698.1 hypothetical protein [Lactonifactor longoviformis]
MLSDREKERLRSLGKQIREIAELDIQKENKKLWTAVNDGQMIRPVVIARDYPVLLLMEGPDAIRPTIEDPYFRQREMEMLLTIYEWNHLRGDRVVEPYLNVPIIAEDSNVGLRMSSYPAQWTMDPEELHRAYAFERVLWNEEDVSAKIKWPKVVYRREETMERYEQMCEIMEGIIQVKLFGIQNFRFAMFDDIFAWTTIDQGMTDLVMNPEYLHLAAERYAECFIHRARQYEALGLISSNNSNTYIGNGGYGYCSDLPSPTQSGIGGRLQDNWGVAQDQIFTSVSPEMTKEFAFEHERAWTDLYPRIYYGCCERLDHKIAELGTFPNLKKISVSPFSNCEAAMEKMGKRYIVSFKAHNTFINLNPCGYELLTEELKKVCRLAKKYGSSVEIIMKSIIDLNHEPQRLWEWCRLASEIVKSF